MTPPDGQPPPQAEREVEHPDAFDQVEEPFPLLLLNYQFAWLTKVLLVAGSAALAAVAVGFRSHWRKG
jgi:hypothetical protein